MVVDSLFLVQEVQGLLGQMEGRLQMQVWGSQNHSLSRGRLLDLCQQKSWLFVEGLQRRWGISGVDKCVFDRFSHFEIKESGMEMIFHLLGKLLFR